MAELRGVILMLPCSYTKLTQVINTSPNKVANKSGIVFGQVPKSCGICAKGLATHDHTVRIFSEVPQVTHFSVVISRHIQLGKGLLGLAVAAS